MRHLFVFSLSSIVFNLFYFIFPSLFFFSWACFIFVFHCFVFSYTTLLDFFSLFVIYFFCFIYFSFVFCFLCFTQSPMMHRGIILVSGSHGGAVRRLLRVMPAQKHSKPPKIQQLCLAESPDPLRTAVRDLSGALRQRPGLRHPLPRQHLDVREPV